MLTVTDEERVFVLNLYEQRINTNVICEEVWNRFGRKRSRNGMLGFIFRLRERGFFVSPDGVLAKGRKPIAPIGVGGRRKHSYKDRQQPLRSTSKTLPKLTFRGGKLYGGPTVPQKVVRNKTDIPYIDIDPVSFFNMTADTCRYIMSGDLSVSEVRYCGHTKSKRSYCAHHAALCYGGYA